MAMTGEVVDSTPVWRALLPRRARRLKRWAREEAIVDDLVALAERSNSPFAALLGIRYVSAEKDRLVAEMTVRDDLCTSPAIAHGGALMAFADTLGATATTFNLRDGQGTTTLESKTNFFAPAPVGSVVRGETVPLHRGRRTMVWETRITNADGRLLVKVTQTQMVLEATG